VPPRVDYELTRLGRSLRQPIRALAKWAEKHRTAVQDARAKYDARVKAESAAIRLPRSA
jgi:DNA-binding HxlR family transcriptional regulator